MTATDFLTLKVNIQGAEAAVAKLAKLGFEGKEIEKTFSKMQFLALSAAAGLNVISAIAVRAADDINRFRLAMEALVGGKAGAKLADDVNQFALKSAYSSEIVREMAQRLLALGVSANDVVPRLEQLSDITAAVGGTSETFFLAAKAFTDIKAKGRIMGQELIQLANAGISLDKLAEAMGRTKEEILNAQGTISFEEFAKGFDKVAAAYKGLSDKLADRSIMISLANLWDAIKFALVPLGNILIAFLAPAVKLLRLLVDGFNALPASLRYIISLGAGLFTILTIFQALKTTMFYLGQYTKIAAFWQATLVVLQTSWAKFLSILRALISLEAWHNALLTVKAALTAAIAAFTGNWAGLAVGLAVAGGIVGAGFTLNKLIEGLFAGEEDNLKKSIEENTEALKENTKAMESFGYGERTAKILKRYEWYKIIKASLGS